MKDYDESIMEFVKEMRKLAKKSKGRIGIIWIKL